MTTPTSPPSASGRRVTSTYGVEDYKFEAAVAALGEAMTIADMQGGLGPKLQVANALAGLWLRKRERQRVRDTLQTVYPCLTRLRIQPDLRDACTLLERSVG